LPHPAQEIEIARPVQHCVRSQENPLHYGRYENRLRYIARIPEAPEWGMDAAPSSRYAGSRIEF